MWEHHGVPLKLTKMINKILQELLWADAEYLPTLSAFIYRHVNATGGWETKREDYAMVAVTTLIYSTDIQLTRLSGCDCMSPPWHDRCFALSITL